MVEPRERPSWRPRPLVGVSAGVHAAALATLAAVPGAWPPVAGALLLNHVVLGAAGLAPRSRLLGANLTRLPPSLAGAGRVALTFDDGPDPTVTPRVLERLAEHGARASFFLIGRRAARHPELVAEIVRRGHRVENHSYSHAYTFAFFGPRAQGREIDRAQELLARLAGRRPTYFRAPAGIRNLWLDLVLAQRGLRLASWTRRGYDAVDGEPRRVIRRLVKNLGAGDVLLLHDGSAARDSGGRPAVLEALPRLLDALAEKGLKATHLPAFEPAPRAGDPAPAAASSAPARPDAPRSGLPGR